MRTILLIASLCVGCTVASDTGRFDTDTTCDLQLRLRNFRAHTDDLFVVSVIQDGPLGGELLTRAIFEPLEDATLNLRMPNAVPPLPTPDRSLARIDFFGDDDSMVGYQRPDEGGSDHSWIHQDACVDGPVVFEHDLVFDALTEPDVVPTAVVVSLCDVPRTAPIEVRVYGDLQTGDSVEERRATALYRFTENPRGDVTRELRIPGIVDRGFEHFIDVYIDANANGAFDSGEMAWSFEFEPDPSTPSCELLGIVPGPDGPCIPRTLEGRLAVCTQGDIVRVSLGQLGMRNQVDSIEDFGFSPNSWLNFDAADTGE